MAYRVLVVDDSKFFRNRLTAIINEHRDLEVIDVAENGLEAVEKAKTLKPDVITMDYEMPQLDGISAVKQILKQCCIPIVMFSSLTPEGARTTLKALEAGAVDFLLKNFTDVSKDSEDLKQRLHKKLLGVAKKANVPFCETPERNNNTDRCDISFRRQTTEDSSIYPRPVHTGVEPSSISAKPRVLLIGASTGGPVAVLEIISKLPRDFPIPIVVVQHMPRQFTQTFAERLNKQSLLSVKEAEDGDLLARGRVYVAPGGQQLMFSGNGRNIKIIDGDTGMTYKPCVDIAFASAAKNFNREVLALVLTGMGADGREGARLLREQQAQIWVQDQQSCVVYGMPAAVHRAGLSNLEVALKDIPEKLVKNL